MSDASPTVFNGRYALQRQLARGGMADVFLARDELLDRPVAVKVLFPEFASDPAFVERFRREAQAVQLAHHLVLEEVHLRGHLLRRDVVLGGRERLHVLRHDRQLSAARRV